MAQVNITVNGRPYAVGCEDGQEAHLMELARLFDRQVRQVSEDMGQLGETRLFRGWSQQINEEIEALVESAAFLSRRKIGAVIAIEREVGLGGIAENGTRINADLTSDLLNFIAL